ncbi:MAG: FGGY family carbohydrate kinase [Planctomycetes bacterium]|nr:FGGY family carbohydrate kinase [Planctomycetota bacterium]
MSLLGIDVGTSGCKAAAFSLAGICLHLAYREYSTDHPGAGWDELNADHVWWCVRQAIAEVAAATKADPISALAVSAMGEAATAVTRDRRILGSSILSSDGRGQHYVDAIKREISQEDFYRINPNILSTGYTLPKLLWLKEHAPEQYNAADYFLLWGGLVEFLLGADPFISYSHANRTLLFDIQTHNWSDKMLKISGIDRSKLPRCLPAGAVAGTVADDMAKQLGLPANVKIVVGGHDQCCNALGAGIGQAGRAVDGIGTYECITPVYHGLPDPAKMLALGLSIEHYLIPDHYVSFIFNQAGSLLRWFRDTFAAAERSDPEIYRRLDAEAPNAPTKLLVLPYFQPTGSPGFVTDASGVMVGLKTSTTRGEIYRALLESITCYFAEPVMHLRQLGIDTSEFIATGGGARSDLWLQIKADILNIPYTRLEHNHGSVAGAAIIAGVATGELPDITGALPRFVRRTRTFYPRTDHHRVYQDRLARYRELYPLMRNYLSMFSRDVETCGDFSGQAGETHAPGWPGNIGA